VLRTLMLGAVLSAATNLLFVWLTGRGHDVSALVFTVSADNLAGGIASSAFVAYLSSLVNQAYSATQYALFTSVMLLLPKFIAGFFRRICRRLRLGGVFHQHRPARGAGAGAGLVRWAADSLRPLRRFRAGTNSA
jgi:hypothetical protein